MNSTLKYYDSNAKTFTETTVAADMSSLQEEFLCLIPPHSCILDCGCGSGRDTLAFTKKGYIVTPIDGSEEMCRYTTELTGIEARRILFEEINYQDEFEGIWACASLLHVKRSDLPLILKKLSVAAKPSGILYMSFKYGDYSGQREDGRFFTDLTEKNIPDLLNQETGWEDLKHEISADVRPERTSARWLNIFARKN